MEYSRDTLLTIYRRMVRIRLFEYKAIEINDEGIIGGSIHTYIGEEAIGATIGALLRDDDYVSSTHRGHGHILGKGAEPKYALAEILGKATGYCKGKGGSMHIADFDRGILGANGIVGGGIPLGVGAGLSAKMLGQDRVSVVYFGDGACNIGSFHESTNLAAVWALPVIFVLENNGYGMTGRLWEHSKQPNLFTRGAGYAMRAVQVNGNDVFEVFEAFTEAMALARAGEGPTLLECMTYRWRGHWEGDRQAYRDAREVEEHKAHEDPIRMLRDRLTASFGVAAGQLDSIDGEERALIREAEIFARGSDYPDVSQLLVDVYSE